MSSSDVGGATGADPGCVGVVSPGEMGAAVAASLAGAGHRVLTVLHGRSRASAERAQAAGMEALDSLEALVSTASIVVSIVPPSAADAVAEELARAVAGAGARPLVVDANAISPARAHQVAAVLEAAGATFVDGDIIGGPPAVGRPPTRLYLSGPQAERAAAAVATPELRPVVLEGPAMAASSLKMAYAGWTKISSALVLTARALARSLGVEEALLGEWAHSQPDLVDRCSAGARSAAKAWRFVGEMEEIAASQTEAGLPSGFAEAAAEVYARLAGFKGSPPASVDEVLDRLMAPG
ncbi:MAG TPA: DUF1932 domain-containing protein [Acidimicrobiales bacterium]|nr:DUF1932 domain-containing protein [Acidimicrobiales bacterium]